MQVELLATSDASVGDSVELTALTCEGTRGFDELGAIRKALQAACITFVGDKPGVQIRKGAMKGTSFIVHEASVQAHACSSELQATEAGVLFGVDLLRGEVDPARQGEIKTALTQTLSKTAPGSHARAFTYALLTTVEAVWGEVP